MLFFRCVQEGVGWFFDKKKAQEQSQRPRPLIEESQNSNDKDA